MNDELFDSTKLSIHIAFMQNSIESMKLDSTCLSESVRHLHKDQDRLVV